MDTNPIGQAQIDLIKDKISEVVNTWLETHPVVKSWWGRVNTNWTEVIDFMFRSFDFFIQVAKDLSIDNADKKATVIAALMQVWVMIVVPLLPIWLKPFESSLKSFVFGVVVSWMIDYFVSKYNNGGWKPEPVTGFKNFR